MLSCYPPSFPIAIKLNTIKIHINHKINNIYFPSSKLNPSAITPIINAPIEIHNPVLLFLCIAFNELSKLIV